MFIVIFDFTYEMTLLFLNCNFPMCCSPQSDRSCVVCDTIKSTESSGLFLKISDHKGGTTPLLLCVCIIVPLSSFDSKSPWKVCGNFRKIWCGSWGRINGILRGGQSWLFCMFFLPKKQTKQQFFSSEILQTRWCLSKRNLDSKKYLKKPDFFLPPHGRNGLMNRGRFWGWVRFRRCHQKWQQFKWPQSKKFAVFVCHLYFIVSQKNFTKK